MGPRLRGPIRPAVSARPTLTGERSALRLSGRIPKIAAPIPDPRTHKESGLLIDGLSRRAFIQAAGAAVIALHPPRRRRARRRRALSWSGYSWTVRPASWDGAPGPNRWSAKNVTVEDGILRLEIHRTRRGWTCAEIQSRRSFGYGHYEFVVNSNLARLDPWVVLGLFTYSDDIPGHHNEFDIEVAKWGRRRDRFNA
jgi:Glycosyl hydrolases family 16